MFLHFFIPKALPKATKKFKGFFLGLLNRYAQFRHDREVKKREKQFYKNASYEEESETINSVDYEESSDNFNDIDVHENNNDVKK